MREMKILLKRNIKLFFKDKAMFLTSLITPVILLVLYSTFLGNVYRDSFLSAFPEGVSIADKIADGFVGGQLISSILAVSCVTISFCSNMLMVQDKANGSIKDLTISPVKSPVLSMSYYFATLASTLIICYVATALCLVYAAIIGSYISFTDILLILLDVFLLVMFGTALSSIINFFLSTQGQISAVGTIVSSGYGFICGAYMPISQFSDGLQKFISLLPGTYGTSLIRNHAMRGVIAEIESQGFPVEEIKDSIDCNLYFFGSKVSLGADYAVLCGTIAVLIAVYILMNVIKLKKAGRNS
ncbi:MAG: ABC transporter permease [Acutalibacteraceae bacterium]